MLLTTTQTATEISNGLSTGTAQPSIFPDKVVTLAHANRLTNVGQGARAMFDQAEVDAFVAETRFVTNLADVRKLHPQGMVYRTSVKPRTERDPGYTAGGVYYKWIGVDFADNPEGVDELGGWCGVWPVDYLLAQDLIANEALIYASLRDYVHKDHLRKIVDAEQVSGRWFFVTEPAPPEVREWLGEGAWIDTPGGSISALV